ncbi:MAG: hypothetical protein R2854_21175 [Caldilineaceae bacterium]
MKTVLFLCSGNYYRSRFAEEYFNHLAREQECDWRGVTRAGGRPSQRQRGPYVAVGAGCAAAQGIATPAAPRAATGHGRGTGDSYRGHRACEAEHRPMLARRFPEYEDEVVYWTVHDLDVATADQVLPALAGAVAELLAQLCRADQGVNKDLTPAKHLLNNSAAQ